MPNFHRNFYKPVDKINSIGLIIYNLVKRVFFSCFCFSCFCVNDNDGAGTRMENPYNHDYPYNHLNLKQSVVHCTTVQSSQKLAPQGILWAYLCKSPLKPLERPELYYGTNMSPSQWGEGKKCEFFRLSNIRIPLLTGAVWNRAVINNVKFMFHKESGFHG